MHRLQSALPGTLVRTGAPNRTHYSGSRRGQGIRRFPYGRGGQSL